jgi:hypothetical protein
MMIAARVCLAAAVFAASAATAQEIRAGEGVCKDGQVSTAGHCLNPPPPPPPADSPREELPRAEAPATAPVQPAAPPVQPAQRSTPARSEPIGGLPAPARRAPITHHYGFFFRPDLGIGYLHAATQSYDASLYGAAGSLGIAVGGAIDHHNIIAFHIWDLAVSNPTGSTAGVTRPIDGSVGLVVMGPEYTYYSDDNIYFSLSPGLSQLAFESNGTTSHSSAGFGLRLALGKEWWVSENWGLGLAGHFSFSANQDSGPNPPTWITWGLSVAFSATYN